MILDIGINGSTNYLKTPTYQSARSERLRIDNFTCQCCGSKKNLEVHHINRENNDAPNAQKDLITLCRTCHLRVEKSIKEKQFLTGHFYFTVISAYIEPYEGSDRMESCNRLRLKLLVYDYRNSFMRYVSDSLPLLDRFAWKWREFMSSIKLHENLVDESTIADKMMNKQGLCSLIVKEGDLGKYNCVDHYIDDIPIDLNETEMQF